MTDRRYSRGDIERIFSSGTIKQKARLFIRDRMGYFGEGFILSSGDANSLPLSFEAWKRKEWMEFVSMGLRIENGFKDMNRSLVQIQQKRNNLLRTLSEIHDFEKIELLLNTILESNIDPEEKNLDPQFEYRDEETEGDVAVVRREVQIYESDLDSKRYRLIRPTLDSENHINLGLSGDDSLREQAEIERNILRAEMTFYLRYEVAIKRRISEFPLVIPEYESLLKKNREVIEQPVSMSLRWVGVQDNRTYQIGECNLKDRRPQEYPFPSLMDMIEDFSVRPQDIDLDSIESQAKITELYNQI